MHDDFEAFHKLVRQITSFLSSHIYTWLNELFVITTKFTIIYCPRCAIYASKSLGDAVAMLGNHQCLA